MIILCGCGEPVDVSDELVAGLPAGRAVAVTCLGCITKRFDRAEAAAGVGPDVIVTTSENN